MNDADGVLITRGGICCANVKGLFLRHSLYCLGLSYLVVYTSQFGGGFYA